MTFMEDTAPITYITRYCQQHGYTNEGGVTTTTLQTGLMTVQQIDEKLIKPCKSIAEDHGRGFNGIAEISKVDSEGYRTVRFYTLPL